MRYNQGPFTESISVSCTPEEKAVIKAAADHMGMTMSEFVRFSLDQYFLAHPAPEILCRRNCEELSDAPEHYLDCSVWRNWELEDWLRGN